MRKNLAAQNGPDGDKHLRRGHQTFEPLAAAYGRRPREHLVDGGFAKLDDIDALAAEGVAVYAPPPAPRTGRDPHAALPGDPGESHLRDSGFLSG